MSNLTGNKNTHRQRCHGGEWKPHDDENSAAEVGKNSPIVQGLCKTCQIK